MIPRFPLTWPDGWKRTSNRQRAKFMRDRRQLSVADGLQRVFRELAALGVREHDVVVSTNIQLRLDGLPRSDRGEPQDPGAAVYWTGKGEQMRVMAVDLYDRVADNLGAIAASLEALRAIERHGGAAILERAFTGFDALPPPRNPFDFLGVSRDHATVETVQVAFKAKLRSHHPDHGGSHNLMSELNWARDEALKIIEARA